MTTCGTSNSPLTLAQGGLVTILCFVFLKETYAPVLLERKAAGLRRSTGDTRYRAKMATEESPTAAVLRALIRPTKLFFTPIVCVFVVYLGITYGYLYLLFTTITEVYEKQYGFSTGIAGLSFLGIGEFPSLPRLGLIT
jgi:hypothetical protein